MNERIAPPTLVEAQAAGFPVGGESLAVDLADTLITAGPEPQDLLVDETTCERFWALHAGVLPDGSASPSLAATRRLRNAIRPLLDAAHQGDPLPPPSIDELNAISGQASLSLSLIASAGGPTRHEHWRASDPVELALAAAARSAIELLADPAQRARLRRCASPTCSMLFVGGDRRRRFCTPNICGNRDRVARHYRRHHATADAVPDDR